MPRTSAEVKDLLDEVEQPFKTAPAESGDMPVSLRDRMDALENIILTRYDYTRELSPLLKTPKSLGAYLLRFYLQQFVASMRQDLGWHLEPIGELQRQESAADRLEKFRAYSWLRLDPAGLIRDSMAWYMGAGFFWSAFLEMDDWAEPEQRKNERDGDYADRAERDKRAFFPWHLTEHNPRAVSFMESQRKLGVAAVRFKLPLIDLIGRFSDGKKPRRDEPDQALKLFDSQWSWLRAGTAGTDVSARDLYRSEAEVCMVDDGQKISYYIDMAANTGGGRQVLRGGGADSERYRPAASDDSTTGGEYDNPFGQVSLLLGQGVYNPGQPIAYRREGVLTPLILIDHAGAILNSHILSRALDLPEIDEHPPPEVAAKLAEMGQPLPDRVPVLDSEGRPIGSRGLSELKFLERAADPDLEKSAAVLERMSQTAAPRGIMFGSGDTTSDMAQAPASTVLAQLDELDKLLAGPTQSKIAVVNQVGDMIEESIRRKLNSQRKQGDAAGEGDWLIAFQTTGDERTKGKTRSGYGRAKRGETVTIKPSDLDGRYISTVTPIDNSMGKRAARRVEARERRADNTVLWDEYLELNGIEDVADFNARYTEEQLYQILAPQEIADAKLSAAKYRAALNGETLSNVLALLPEGADARVMGAAGAAAGYGGGGYQMQAPATSGNATAVDSQVVT